MFEAFSNEARMIVFFARYEAGRLRSEYIDVPHILLGFILQDQGMTDLQILRPAGMEEAGGSESTWSVPKQQSPEPFLDRVTAEKLQSMFSNSGADAGSRPNQVDLPLTEEAKRLLIASFEQADGATVIPLHLLWAMLGEEEGRVANGLRENGITGERIDTEIRRRSHG